MNAALIRGRDVSTSAQAVTARIAQRLAGQVGQHRFNMWFDRSARLQYRSSGDDRQLDVAVPNPFVLDWIDRHFREELCRAAAEEVGNPVALLLHIEPQSFGVGAGMIGVPAPDVALAAGAAQLPVVAAAKADRPASSPRSAGKHTPRAASQGKGDRQLRYRLDDFIVGPSNELAYSAAQQLVAEEHASVNPLFIHGGVGLGKTHLLQGICQKFQELHPNARILYTTGEKFTNEYLAAMGARSLDKFRQRIRRLDLLAIDDVHFLAGKDKTQQEFLHSFDEIDLGGARVVMASDNPPKQIKQFSVALVSRCVRGLVVEVNPPDTSTRVRIVKALAERRGMTLLESVLGVLAGRCQGSVREIEGTLAKLHALANMTEGRLSKGDVAAVLEGRAPSTGSIDMAAAPAPIGHAVLNQLFASQTAPPRKRIGFDRILHTVCEQMNVPVQQVLGSQRVKPVVLARSLVIYLARQLTTMSYPEISVAIKKNSHSTIIAADRRIAVQIAEDEPLGVGGELELIPLSQLIERLKQAILKA